MFCTVKDAASWWALLLVLSFLPSPAVAGETIPLRIIDGDTLVLDGETIRMSGIDAPELSQICFDQHRRTVLCGVRAKRHLEHLAGQGPVHCSSRNRDAYGRRLATCTAGGLDLNARMVRDGHAFAFRRYSDRYIGEEAEARRDQAGLWSGRAEEPWAYRTR